jgi:triphosphoribosyl-dephospho-CoA synthase
MEKLISQGFHPEQATLEVLLHLYLHCEDSTVLHRRGEEGLSLLRRSASRFLSDRGIRQPEYLQRLDEMNTLFVSENISPGGCADLLALTLFIHRMGEKF